MSRRRALTDEQTQELFQMVRKGFSNRDIAKKFGISDSTVSSYYRRALRERSRDAENNERRPRIVASRGQQTYLTFSVDDGYVGCYEDEYDTRTFKAADDVDAAAQFDKWVDDMDAEREFLERIERRVPEPPQDENASEPHEDAEDDGSAYLLWARCDRPKCYGLFRSMETALREMDRLNELAAFLDRGSAFEVEEVPWR